MERFSPNHLDNGSSSAFHTFRNYMGGSTHSGTTSNGSAFRSIGLSGRTTQAVLFIASQLVHLGRSCNCAAAYLPVSDGQQPSLWLGFGQVKHGFLQKHIPHTHGRIESNGEGYPNGILSALCKLWRYSRKARRPFSVACTHVRGLEFKNSLAMVTNPACSSLRR